MKTIIRAGAGAGKTWTLTRQVIQEANNFFATHGRWPKTVVTTFTRKATQELRERILEYCLEECPQAVPYAQSDANLFITTIHGLLDRFLRLQGHRFGLASQYKIVDSSQGAALRKRILKDIFRDHPNYCALLNEFEFRRLLVTFGDMEGLGFRDSATFATAETFEDLAKKSWERIGSEVAEVASKIIRDEVSQDWSAYGQSLLDLGTLKNSSWGALRKNLKLGISSLKRPRKSKKNPGLDEADDLRLKKVLGEIKVLSESPEYESENWARAEALHNLFFQVFDLYRQTLKEEKLSLAELEVSDLENYGEWLIEKSPEAVERFRQDWDSWFIDEFQDTSPQQLNLLRPFVKNSRALFVGDPQQSIYLFRGARSEVFLDTEKEVASHPQGEVLYLKKNYRSQEPFIGFINEFFPQVSSGFAPMLPVVPEVNRTVVEVMVAPNDEERRACEVNGVVAAIHDLLSRGVQPKDIGVLGRTNKDLERIGQALSRGNYPFLSHSSSGFFKRTEIQDALALLSVLVSPMDDFKLIQFLRSPWFPMEDQEIVDLVSKVKSSYWPVLVSFFQSEGHEAGLKLLEYGKMARKVSVPWAFRQALIGLGMIETSQDLDSSGRMEANLWKLVNILEKSSREPGTTLLDILENQTLAFDLEADSTENASSAIVPDKVNLMTVHASKGLQFRYIFVPFLDKKLNRTSFLNFSFDETLNQWALRLPLGEQGTFIGTPLEKNVLAERARREEEESLRLFYVALTRAKEKVFLSWSGVAKEGSWGQHIADFFGTSSEGGEGQGYSWVWKNLDNEAPPSYVLENGKGEVRGFWATPGTEFSEASIGDEERDSGNSSLDIRPQDFFAGQTKRVFGVWLHEVFEFINHKDFEDLDSLFLGAEPEDRQRMKSAFRYVRELEEPPMFKLFETGFREWAYQVKAGGRPLEGRIDLWGVVDKTLWIVDYKTGSSRFKDKAFRQLEGYAKILSHAQMELTFDDIQLVALFPMEEKVFTQKA